MFLSRPGSTTKSDSFVNMILHIPSVPFPVAVSKDHQHLRKTYLGQIIYIQLDVHIEKLKQ